jgi:hypothetical protein
LLEGFSFSLDRCSFNPRAASFCAVAVRVVERAVAASPDNFEKRRCGDRIRRKVLSRLGACFISDLLQK